MVWVIVVVAIVVLALGAWAATGRLGEMPEVVIDRPKGRIPDGPIDRDFLAAVRFPVCSTGYRQTQVDDYLAALVEGDGMAPEAVFDVVPRGYDMQVVDAVLDRAVRPHRPEPAATTDSPIQTDGKADAGLAAEVEADADTGLGEHAYVDADGDADEGRVEPEPEHSV